MVCLYGEQGALQEVREVLQCEILGEQLPAKYRLFELGRVQAPAEEAKGSHPMAADF